MPVGDTRRAKVALIVPDRGPSPHSIPSFSFPPLPYTEMGPAPRYRLGVSCLALDTSTQLVGRGAPEDMLYVGGRDGLVIAWDLGIL